MATSDLGHQLTDKELAKLERRIAKLYREAGKELQETIDAYFEQFKKRDEEMKALIGTVQNGKEWTEADYKQWRLNQIGRGERYQAMRDKVAHRVTDANAVAVSYTNDATPGIYSLNRNYAAYTIESVAGDVGFDLWDEQTVKRLIVEQPGVDAVLSKGQSTETRDRSRIRQEANYGQCHQLHLTGQEHQAHGGRPAKAHYHHEPRQRYPYRQNCRDRCTERGAHGQLRGGGEDGH